MNVLPHMAKRTVQMPSKILRWGDYPGFSTRAQNNCKDLYKREAERSLSRERDVPFSSGRFEDVTLMAFKRRKAKSQPLETGKRDEILH